MKAAIAVLVGLLIGVGAIFAADRTGVINLSSDDTTTTSTTESTTTTSEATTTSSTTSPVDPAVALWPPPGSGERFDSPEAVARDFASEFIGFTDVVVGSFQAGDPSSGEVPVQPRSNGPVTTILVRQLQPGEWWATGAINSDIRLDLPEPGARVTSPIRVTGAANAFEGTVQVEVRADRATKAVGNGFVTGAQGSMGSFDEEIRFDEAAARPAEYGALVLFEGSGMDGSVNKATVIRIRF